MSGRHQEYKDFESVHLAILQGRQSDLAPFDNPQEHKQQHDIITQNSPDTFLEWLG